MNRRPDHRGRRHTLILSDIYQSGQTPEALYKEVSDLARKRGVVKFIGIGPELCKQHDTIQISESSSSRMWRSLSIARSLPPSAMRSSS